MIAFIEEHRDDIGVEPICRHLPIAPCTFYDHMAKRANRDLLSDQAKCDKVLRSEIERVWEQNQKVYGVRKVWHQLRRKGFDVARCTVATADEGFGPGGRHSRQKGQNDDTRKGATMTAGQGETPVPGACAGHALGQRYYLCRHLARVLLRGICD